MRNIAINDILSRLRYMKPFIYKLADEYFYLGANVCHKCNAEEVIKYEIYLSELEKLDAYSYHVECRDSKLLDEAVRNIMDIPSLEDSSDCKWRLKMVTKIESLSPMALQDVGQQLRSLDRAFKYISGSYCIDKQSQ